MRLGELQAGFGLRISPEEYAQENLKFGLVEVVYEWAKVLPFLLFFLGKRGKEKKGGGWVKSLFSSGPFDRLIKTELLSCGRELHLLTFASSLMSPKAS